MRVATSSSQPEIAVTSSRCMIPTHGPSIWKNSRANAVLARSADQMTSDRQRTSREKVQVRTNMPITTQRKQTAAVKMWIQPKTECE